MMAGNLKEDLKRYLNAEGTQHTIMTAHLSFIDRFTRTIKSMLFERVQHTGKQWHILLPNVIKQYNNTIHESTSFIPVDATHDKNAVEVKANLMLRARFKRKYKDININDKVRVLEKSRSIVKSRNM